ncbi:MAG: LysR family transcriptional regulator [Deltaproteobacteria bacterium]|nr:MAG: LysR family transcriptional regulator [Deltaproteobacteria bacterium]
MDMLSAMLTFVKIVESKSFAEASRQLHVPRSTLSRRISKLEEHLGVQLLIRTTRTLHVTDVGEAYYLSCVNILDELKETEALLTTMSTTPKGVLRVSLPVDGTIPIFGKLVARFLSQFPDVQLDVLSATRQIHLVDEGFDVAIRASKLADSSLVARRIFTTTEVVVASPSYLEQHGTPKTLDDLRKHTCLLHGLQESYLQWRGVDGELIPVKSRLRSNNLEFLRHSAIEGLGIAMLPNVFVNKDIQEGRLLSILIADVVSTTNVYVVYPTHQYMSPKVRSFVDFCVEYFTNNPPTKL